MNLSIVDQVSDFCNVASTAVQSVDERAWLFARTLGIGGSDVGAICGVNPWSSALQVYFNKTGQYQDDREPDDASKERMHWGHVLEPIVAEEFMRRNEGLICEEANCTFRSNTYEYLLANVDRFVVNESGTIVGILECKTANSLMAPEWEAGEIPISYYYQVQHYMFVTGVHRGWICCLVGGNKFFQYDIFFDEDLYTNTILPVLKAFWNDNVLKLTEPKAQVADSDMFSELFPADATTDEPVSLDLSFDDIGKQYMEAKRAEKEAKKQVEELQAQIKQRLMESTHGFSPSYEFAWVPRTRNSVDSATLKALYPDVYEACVKTTTYRQMSVKALNNEEIGF